MRVLYAIKEVNEVFQCHWQILLVIKRSNSLISELFRPLKVRSGSMLSSAGFLLIAIYDSHYERYSLGI